MPLRLLYLNGDICVMYTHLMHITSTCYTLLFYERVDGHIYMYRHYINWNKTPMTQDLDLIYSAILDHMVHDLRTMPH